MRRSRVSHAGVQDEDVTNLDRLREFLAILLGIILVFLVCALAVVCGVIAFNLWGDWAYPVVFFPVLIVGVSFLAVFLFPLMTKIRGW